VIEERAPGDGLALVSAPELVPEPLYITSSRDRLIVWWRARHRCDVGLRPSARVEGGRKLVLDVQTTVERSPCVVASTVFETRLRRPQAGVWEIRAREGASALGPLFFTVPSAPKPAELDSLRERVEAPAVARRIAERVAWTYHSLSDSRSAIAAYRWLVGLDELHWRATLYKGRLFGNIALTRSKSAAAGQLDELLVAYDRLERTAASAPPRERAVIESERDALRAWLEPLLRYIVLRWHNEALGRLRTPIAAYRAYFKLFAASEHATQMRFFFGGALAANGDEPDAQRQLALAAEALPDGEQRTLATACAVALGLKRRSDDMIAPCRRLVPTMPPVDIIPDIDDERFARPASSVPTPENPR
jgi:hypothetical protein